MLPCKIEIGSRKYEVENQNFPCNSAKLKSKVSNVKSGLETSHVAVQRMKLEVGVLSRNSELPMGQYKK